MANLQFTKVPERGDAVLGDLSTKKPVFLKANSFSSLSDIDTNAYEVIGVVAKREGNKVLIVYKENASKVWSNRYSYKLTVTTGATSGKLTIRQSSDSWAAGHDCTISWTNAFANDATHRAEIVTALNTYFAANSPFKGTEQDWKAEEVGEEIHVHFKYSAWQQSSYTSGSSGFGLTANLLPEIPAIANMLRKHGGIGGEGAISNWYRALAYFRADNSSTTYNPSSDVTDIKRGYPICLPGYLGTSTYQSDHCAALRAVYGEGEAGWLKFMESCLPVVPSDYGNMGMNLGLQYTKILASKIYTSQAQPDGDRLCPAAYYCYNKGTQAIPQGKWYLPSAKEVYDILDGVQYGTNGSRNSDILNATLYKLSASAISNGSNYWSSLRFHADYAWYAHGGFGFFYNRNMCYSYLAVPVSLYTLA